MKKIFSLIILSAFTFTVVCSVVPINAWAAPQTGDDIVYAFNMQTAGGADRRTINKDGSIRWSANDQAIIHSIRIGSSLIPMLISPGTYYIKFWYKNGSYTGSEVQGVWGNSSNGDSPGACLDPEKLIKYDGITSAVINRHTAGQWNCAIIPIEVTQTTPVANEQTLRAQVISSAGLITTGQYLYYSSSPDPLESVYEDTPAYEQPVPPVSGSRMSWPDDKLLPHMGTPAEITDAVDIDGANAPEQLLARVAQGIVNKHQPRVSLVSRIEGRTSETFNKQWDVAAGLELEDIPQLTARERIINGIVSKYRNEFSGYVLYPTNSAIADAAATEASLYEAVPITPDMVVAVEALGLIRVGTDFTNTSVFPPASYPCNNDWVGGVDQNEVGHRNAATWIYNNLRTAIPGPGGRPGYNKRMICFTDATMRRQGSQCIDLAAATGAPIVFADYGIAASRPILQAFYEDMNAAFPMTDTHIGPVGIGFWFNEGVGVKGTSLYGISVVPSDNFRNYTIWATPESVLDPPAIGSKPVYDPNKRYISLVVSDGDNISMYGGAQILDDFWGSGNRGKAPLTYTAPPALIDAAPGMFNYYYKTAAANDAFTGGPTGLGYYQTGVALNTWEISEFNRIGETDRNLFGRMSAAGADFPMHYAKWTNAYFEKTGLNSTTLWYSIGGENAMENLNKFANPTYFPSLLGIFSMSGHDDVGVSYGATYWAGDVPQKVFDPGTDGQGRYQNYFNGMSNTLKAIPGTVRSELEQQFFTYQIVAWSGAKDGGGGYSERMLNMVNFALNNRGPYKEFVRADHFLMLMQEAQGKPINNALRTITKAYDGSNAVNLVDGSFGETHMWMSDAAGDDKWVIIDFARRVNLSRYVIKNAELTGLDASLNTKSYTIEASNDNKTWVPVGGKSGNTAATDYGTFTIPAAGEANRYRFVRFTITDPGADGVIRLGEIEIFGVNNQTKKYYDNIQLAMDAYEALVSSDEYTKYTPASWAKAAAEYAKAVSMYNAPSATQKNLDDVADSLNAALEVLEESAKMDTDFNGMIEVNDAFWALKSAANGVTQNAGHVKYAADLDDNGVVTAAEALYILKVALGCIG